MAHLTLLLDNREVRKFVLNRGVTTIGRAQDNDIVINNLALSRRHAQVELKGSRFEVVDLQSQNGVFVNQERVRGPRPLEDRDSITLGTYQFIFRSSEESEPNVKVRQRPRQESAPPPPPEEPPEPAEPSSPLLVLKYNDVELQRFPLVNDSCMVGRAKECDVQIPERRLSRKHCEIRRVGGRYEVLDLGSQNGTYVNRRRIKGTHELAHGDLLNFAEYSVLFLAEAGQYEGPDAEPASPRPSPRSLPPSALEKEQTAAPRAYRDDDRVQPSDVDDPDELSRPPPPVSNAPKRANEEPARGARRPEDEARSRRSVPAEEPPVARPRRAPEPEERPRRAPEPEPRSKKPAPEDRPRRAAPEVEDRRRPAPDPEEHDPLVKSPAEARQKRRVLRPSEQAPRRSEPPPTTPPRRSVAPVQEDPPGRSKPPPPGGRSAAVRVEPARPSKPPRRVEESDVADPEDLERDASLEDWYSQRQERSEIFERPQAEPDDGFDPPDEEDRDSLLPPRGQSSVSQVLSQMMVERSDVDTNLKPPKTRKRRFAVDVRHHDKLLYSGPLVEEVTILGTDREADIKLKGRYVAGRHSLLVRVRDSLLLVRLGSSSAARVNGLPKLQAFLKTGDVIQIDETTITVTEE